MKPFKLCVAVLALSVAGWAADACENPVYAKFYEDVLPDFYTLIYYHGEGAEADATLVEALDKLNADPYEGPNLVVRKADVGTADKWSEGSSEYLFYEAYERPEPPYFVLGAPNAQYAMDPKVGVLYSGRDLTTDKLAAILNSPARLRIAQTLAAGRHGLLVMVEGDNKWLNELAGAAVAVGTLNDLDDEGQPIDSGFIRVRRDDPAEQWLLKQLFIRPSIPRESREPMLFPVFGRGLVMEPLVGREINTWNVEYVVAGILNADCTCIAREQLLAITLPMLTDFNWFQPVEDPPADDPFCTPVPAPSLAGGLAAAPLQTIGAPGLAVLATSATSSADFFDYFADMGLALPTVSSDAKGALVAKMADIALTPTRPTELDVGEGDAWRGLLHGAGAVMAGVAALVLVGSFIIMMRSKTSA